jgi:signal transduction histidine kinase
MGELTQDQQTIAALQQQLSALSERLIESEKPRTLFISNMLNEINNPLTTILGLSQPTLNVKNVDLEQINQKLSWINEEAKFLEFQLRNVFAAAELESGSLKAEASMVDVHELWAKVCTPYINVLQRKRLRVSTNGDGLLPSRYSEKVVLASNSRLLSLVFINLFDNAIKVAPQGSMIEVDFWLDDTGLTLRVTDAGMGISQEDQVKIFDRFRQLDSSTTKKILGMGLGLSLVMAVADALSGTCSVKSALGEGASFTVHINALEISDIEQEDYSDDLMFFDDEEYGSQGEEEGGEERF